LRPVAAALLPLVLLAPLLTARAWALPVVADGRVPVDGGNPAVAQRAALAVALARAVELVLERHVPASELQTRAREVKAAFLARPSPYIQRYSISSEGPEGDGFTVSLEAEVAQEKLLGELRAMGFSVHLLAARPRILVAALGGGEATAVAQGLRRILDAQGYVARTFPGAAAETVDEAAAAGWARDLGCHVAFAVFAAPEEEAPAPEGGAAGPAPVEAPPPRVRAADRARGWVVDARRATLLGQAEVVAVGEGADPVAASGRAATRAGERLASALLAQLEQSGWELGATEEVIELAVRGLTGPAVLELIQKALPSVTEVRSAELAEVGHRSAVWRLTVRDGGLGPGALVVALRLGRGRLSWVETIPAAPGHPLVVHAEWLER